MLKLGNLKKMVKSKRILGLVAGTVAICVVVAVVVLSVVGSGYSCTREDIMNNSKISNTMGYIFEHNLSETDTIKIYLHFYQKPSEIELNQLESLGIEVFTSLWTPYPDDPLAGFYPGRCEVANLCRFIDLNFVKRVTYIEEVY